MMQGKKKLVAAAACLLLSSAAPAQVDGTYQPKDKDERGLWMQADEYERQLATSNFVIRDPALNDYVRDVLCRTIGEARCTPIRIYVVRTPYFNASMAPNGMLTLWSGVFLRARDEAQLAAILAHEYGHYEKRHSLQFIRDAKKKTDAMVWLSFVPLGFLASLGVAGSIASYNRDMEREADAGSVQLLAGAGYDPLAASRIWEQARAEMDATAAARGKKSRKDRDGGLFASHPPTAERMTELALLARKQPEGAKLLNAEAYRAALGGWWQFFVDDQIKLNDFGGTELLLSELAKPGWTGELLFARAELYRSRGRPEDLTRAIELYREAMAEEGCPVDGYRGLGLALLRSGANAEGQAVLREYLSRKPEAVDKAMLAALAGGI